MADVFPSQLHDPYTAALLPSLDPPHPPQTLTEVIVQRYTLGLEKSTMSGLEIKPHSRAYVIIHDNSQPMAKSQVQRKKLFSQEYS